MQNWFSSNGDATVAPSDIQPVQAELLAAHSSAAHAQDDSKSWDAAVDAQGELALLSQAQQAIAQVQDFDEIKNIRDKAEAVRKYAQSVGMGLELQNYAAEVKLRAERKAGELLTQMQLHGGDRKSQKAEERPKLEDIGISKDQSSRWQLTAAISEREFEKYVAQTKSTHGEVTTAGLLRVAKKVVAKKRRKEKQKRTREASTELTVALNVITSLSVLLEQQTQFGCLYANPLWSRSDDEAEASLDSLLALPIQQICAENAHLHLWVPEDLLFESQRLFTAWGFRFAGGFIWLKAKSGPGPYWRQAHEHLLLGVRGSLPFRGKSATSWLQTNRPSNDEKPEAIRKLIEQVSPGPYLELFGRKAVEGWTVFRNEAVPTKQG